MTAENNEVKVTLTINNRSSLVTVVPLWPRGRNYMGFLHVSVKTLAFKEYGSD